MTALVIAAALVFLAATIALHSSRRRANYGAPAVTTRPRGPLCPCGAPATTVIRTGFDNWDVCAPCKARRNAA